MTASSYAPYVPGDLPPFDPMQPEYRADPYTIYRRYRERSPVHWSEVGARGARGRGAWYLFRNEDVAMVLRDPRFGRERHWSSISRFEDRPSHDCCGPFFSMKRLWILFRDPPFHTRIRSLVNQGFTPGAVARMHSRIEALTNELLDRVEDAGSFELMADFASRLPPMVIAELLGVGPEERNRFLQHADSLAAALDLSQSRDAHVRAAEAVMAVGDCLRDTIRERHRRPRDDLITALLSAREQEKGQTEPLSEDELLATCVLLLLAGSETTINLIGNGLLALLRHPDELARLRAHPELLPVAVEELLRYDSPTQMTDRIAREDVEVGGKTIGAGSQLWLMLGAANRDPEAFPDPDRLDLARRTRLHKSFGHGAHFCIGAPLARVEGQIAIHNLLGRFPGLHLTSETPEWRESIFIRGVKALPLEW